MSAAPPNSASANPTRTAVAPPSLITSGNPLKDAHSALDAAVLTAYGFSAKKDLLAQLLALNLEVAARIEPGEPVTALGVPRNYPDPAKLVTKDCIKPQKCVNQSLLLPDIQILQAQIA